MDFAFYTFICHKKVINCKHIIDMDEDKFGIEIHHFSF